MFAWFADPSPTLLPSSLISHPCTNHLKSNRLENTLVMLP